MNEEVANVSTNKYMLEPGSRVLLADLGLDGARVLLVGGQPADLLGRGPVALDEDEYFALWRALEALFDDPDLPIRIAEALSPEFFDPAIFAALASAHLDEAAGRIARYKKLISPVRLDIKRDDRSLTITFQHPSPSVPASLVTTELLFWVALVRLGTRRRVEPRQVSGPFALEHSAAYEQYLGIPVTYSELPTVTFSSVDADRPFLTSNATMWATFEPELSRRLGELERDATTSDRVRAVLLELLPGESSSMQRVAARLAMSTRTLQRRLQGEDTTFKAVLNATRKALALHYLANPDLSAAEISFLLGFEDPSSFYRAFHGWTGQTPERARATVA